MAENENMEDIVSEDAVNEALAADATGGAEAQTVVGGFAEAAGGAFGFVKDTAEDITGKDLDGDGQVGQSGKAEGEVKSGATAVTDAAADGVVAAVDAVTGFAGNVAGALHDFAFGEAKEEAPAAEDAQK